MTDLFPVAEALRSDGALETSFLVFDRPSETRARGAGYPAMRASTLVPAHDLAAAAAQLVGPVRRAFASMPRAAAQLRYDEAQALGWAARRVFQQNLTGFIRVALATAHIARNAEPCAFLIGNSYTLEGRVAARVAHGYGIPSLTVEHGSIFPNSPFWVECPVDAVCAWGDASREVIVSCGVDEAKTVVTGSPRMDAVVRSFRRDPRARPMILVGTSGAGGCVGLEEHKAFIETLLETAAANTDLDFVVKLHPKDSEELYRPAMSRHGKAAVRVERGDPMRAGEDIYDFLRGASALLTISSTCALDAMLVDVPVIVAKLGASSASLRDVPYLNAPIALAAHSRDELATAVRACAENEQREMRARASSYLRRHFANAGCASNAVAESLLKLVREKSASPVAASVYTSSTTKRSRAPERGLNVRA